MAIFRAVYNILWGDIISIPLARREQPRAFPPGADPGPGGDLLYDTDEVPSVPDVPGDDQGDTGK